MGQAIGLSQGTVSRELSRNKGQRGYRLQRAQRHPFSELSRYDPTARYAHRHPLNPTAPGADSVVRLPTDAEFERPIPLQPKTFSRHISRITRTRR
jgi:hypothetical protein